MKTALIVDVSNLYYETMSKYPDRTLRIVDYTKYIEGLGHSLVYKAAYSKQPPDRVQSFSHMLNCNGYETHFGQKPWHVAMALRATEMLPHVDCFILGSNADEMGRVLKFAKNLAKITRCIAVNIPPHFAEFAECIEVPEVLLSEARPQPK